MRKLLAVMLVVLLLVSASGCGLIGKAKDLKDQVGQIGDVINDLTNLVDDVDDIDDVDDDPEDEALFMGEVFYPGDYKELISAFHEFGYEWTNVSAEGETSDWSFYYRVEGREEIDGLDTEIITVVKVEYGETQEYKFWIDQEWNCVKATKGDEEADTWESGVLSMLTQLYVNTVLITSSVIKPDATIDPFSHELVGDGYYSAVFADENYTVYTYDILSKFGNVTSTYGLAELAGRLTYVLIKHDSNTTSYSDELRVTHAHPR